MGQVFWNSYASNMLCIYKCYGFEKKNICFCAMIESWNLRFLNNSWHYVNWGVTTINKLTKVIIFTREKSYIDGSNVMMTEEKSKKIAAEKIINK